MLTILLKKGEDLEKMRSLKLTFEINWSRLCHHLSPHILDNIILFGCYSDPGGRTKKKLQYIGDTVLNVL